MVEGVERKKVARVICREHDKATVWLGDVGGSKLIGWQGRQAEPGSVSKRHGSDAVKGMGMAVLHPCSRGQR